MQPDGSTVTSTTNWTYDDLQRLTGETYASSVSSQDYSDVYTYDLASNRMSSVHTGPGGGSDETINYTYTGDNELWSQTSSLSGTTTNSYDDNGSLKTARDAAGTSPRPTRTTSGIRWSATATARPPRVMSMTTVATAWKKRVNGTATYYLTDTQNPTGYAQPLEAKSSPTATPSMTYFLGERVIAQADASGTVTFLLPDGHGSTEQLANSSGTVTAAFQYDAFGTALNFTPAVAGVVFLFGGDAVYDPASGTYLNGDGVRARRGLSLSKWMTAGGTPATWRTPTSTCMRPGYPINGSDPSGPTPCWTNRSRRSARGGYVRRRRDWRGRVRAGKSIID